MSLDTYYTQVPLTDEDKSVLDMIYKTRMKYSLLFYSFMIALIGFNTLRVDHRNRYSRRITYWEENKDAKFVSRYQMSLIAFCFLGIPTICAGTYYFRKKVLPFKRDIQKGVKNKIPYTIMRKEYFEHIGKCYFALDDPNYLHHEVNVESFSYFNEGDTVYLYRAPLSGYTFNMNGDFTL